jgi:hypothetical protein
MKSIDGTKVDDSILALLEPGECAVASARPNYSIAHPGKEWIRAALVLTDRRLLIAKDRLFGKPKVDFSLNWADVTRVDVVSFWRGSDKLMQLLVHNSRTREPVELIVETEYVVAVESAITAQYLKGAG